MAFQVQQQGNNIPVKQGKHRCNLCGKAFMNLWSQRWHMLGIHTNVRWFQCDLCEKTSTYHANLLKHKKDSHFRNPNPAIPMDGNARSSFLCSLCRLKFTAQGDFFRHTKDKHPLESNPVMGENVAPEGSHIVRKQGKHRCSLCDKTFMILASRRWHMLGVHTNIRWFMCDLCDKTHRYYANLLKHKKDSHFQNFAVMPADGYPSFRCALCQEKFTSQCPFFRHIEGKHPGETAAVLNEKVGKRQVKHHAHAHAHAHPQPAPVAATAIATIKAEPSVIQNAQQIVTTTDPAYIGQHVSLVYNPNPYYNVNVNDNK